MKEEGNPIKSMIEESGFDPREFVEVEQALATLRTVVPTDAPPPSAELAALLSGARVTPLPAQRTRRGTVALAAGATAAVLAVGTGVAAAANTLPEPAQRFLSDFSDSYLPVHFPSPEEREEGDAPSGPGADNQAEQSDNGKHVGGGAGLGKTDNLGQHNGPPAVQPGEGNPSPGDPQGDDNADGGEGVGGGTGAGETDNPGNGKPTAPPSNAPSQPPRPSEPPRAEPDKPTPTTGKGSKPPEEDSSLEESVGKKKSDG